MLADRSDKGKDGDTVRVPLRPDLSAAFGMEGAASSAAASLMPPRPKRSRTGSTSANREVSADCSAVSFLSNDSHMSYVYSDDEEDDSSYPPRDDTGSHGVLAGVPRPTAAGKDRAVSELSIITDGGYRIWSAEKVRAFMEGTVREATDVLCIPPSAAAVLLRKYKWDGKKLVDEYFGNEDKLLGECGVLQRCQNRGSDGAGLKSANLCAICFEEDLEQKDLFSMRCGHEFCRDCWRLFLEQALSNGPRCIYAKCPHPKCSEVVTEEEVGKMAPNLLPEYRTFQLRSYVETNWLMRWCPGPSCDRVAVASSMGLSGEGQCKCGTWFCLRCGESRHTPASCEMMMLWKKKNSDDSETANWMIAKTKKCPKCHVRIEKNQGCSHMTCANCDFHFCWLCLLDWSVHGYDRPCNRFELEKGKQLEEEGKDKAEEDLERFLHCFDRFQNHSQGQQFAQDELKKFQEKIKSDDENEQTDKDKLAKALGQLIECRRVLKYTYIVTYFLKDKPAQRELFQDHQALLERFTEMLSEHTEHQHHDQNEIHNLTWTVCKYTKNVMEYDLDDMHE